MKKLLTILAIGLVGSASAVTLNWSATTANQKILGLTAGTDMSVPGETASMTVYYFLLSDYDTIVNLGKVKASDLSSYVVATAAGQTSTSASAAGRIKASTKTTEFTAAGIEFFARAYATFSEQTYFIDLFGGAGSDGQWVTTMSGDASTPESLAWKNATYGGSTSTTAGTKNAWVAVPEPSTAALALAGLALLLKRRKA